MQSEAKQTTQQRLQRLTLALLAAFAAISLASIYWSVIRSPAMVGRDDNPRLVEGILRVQRGRILDRNNNILAETVGPADELRRHYPSAAGGHAVGYYSFRHGTAGVEEAYNAQLMGEGDDVWGEAIDRLLHRPPVGRDVRLTLDGAWQEEGISLLAGRRGAIVLLTLPDGGIRVMVSQPDYDPNRLEEMFAELADDANAPLLNRVTQGQYQPGLVLQPMILAAAVEQGLIELDAIVTEPAERILVPEGVIRCGSRPPEPANYVAVLQHTCPAPLLPLADRLGPDGIRQIWNDFGLTEAPSVAVRTEVSNPEVIDDPGLALLGQENLTVSPLQVALAWSALAGNGRLPDPQLVAEIENENGGWEPVNGLDDEGRMAISPAVARAVYEALPRDDGRVEHSVTVLSGPDGATNGWYLGLAPATTPRYAVVVVVEESDDATAQEIGRALLEMVLRTADG